MNNALIRKQRPLMIFLSDVRYDKAANIENLASPNTNEKYRLIMSNEQFLSLRY